MFYWTITCLSIDVSTFQVDSFVTGFPNQYPSGFYAFNIFMIVLRTFELPRVYSLSKLQVCLGSMLTCNEVLIRHYSFLLSNRICNHGDSSVKSQSYLHANLLFYFSDCYWVNALLFQALLKVTFSQVSLFSVLLLFLI